MYERYAACTFLPKIKQGEAGPARMDCGALGKGLRSTEEAVRGGESPSRRAVWICMARAAWGAEQVLQEPRPSRVRAAPRAARSLVKQCSHNSLCKLKIELLQQPVHPEIPDNCLVKSS